FRLSPAYRVRGGSTVNNKILSGRKPNVADRKFDNVLMNRPAPTKSKSDRQIWKTTREFPTISFGRLIVVRTPSFSAALSSTRFACQAGARLNTTPVSTVTAIEIINT